MKKFLGISALVLAAAFSMAACDDDTDGGPVCGNGIIEEGESCDSTELGGRSCVNEGYVGGTLRCAGDCQTYLKSQCHKCGNNHIDDDEACDGDDFGSASCEASGFGSGDLSCSDDCMAIDESACTMCGDNHIDDGETCDGTALGGKNCQAFGYEGGTLVCESTCEGYVATYCHLCGNGELDDGEVCDGEDFGELSCETEGYFSGDLACAADCQSFSANTCTSCGNGQIDDGEVCDDVFLDDESCMTQGFEGGDLSCSSDCTAFVETDCHLCGNGQIDNDEVCDGEDFGTATCVNEGFEGGDLGCEADCSAVTTQSCSLGAGELCELYYAANPPPFKELACSFEPMPNYWDVAEDNIRDYYCSPGSEGWTWATAQLSAQNTGHMTIDWIQAKSCLEATRAFRADSAEYLRAEGSAEWKTIVDGVCADLAQGLLVENEACLGDWECAGELGCYTDTPTVADSLKCMPKVAAGGTYVPDFHLCDEKTSRPDGDSTTPTCVALFAEDESCSGVGTCLPGFRCDSGSAICLAELDLGDSCTQDDDCTALGACRACRIVTSGGTEVCALRALESEYCDADDECLDGLTCVENECIVAREGEYCDDSIDCAYGYECTDVCINYDNQTDCEVASECAWSGSACLTQVGGDICYKTPVIGDDCYGLGCENSYCDADTIVCTAYAAKGEACSTGNASGTTDPVCAPLSGALCTAGICVMSCYSDEQCVDGEYCSFIVTPAVCASVVTESCQEVTACGPAKYCSSSNTCVDKLALGEVCDARVVDASYRSQLCASGWCYDEDGDNSGLCTVEPLGLSDKNLGFLYSTFLFGFIFLGWRRRK